MSWGFSVMPDAKADLKRLPSSVRTRFTRTLDKMAADPFQGNVKALSGQEWKNVFRRRIGDYRILFTVNHQEQMVYILRVLIRSKDTYA